jgi:hypothetical protein
MATTLIPPFSLKLVTLPHGGATVKFNFNPFRVDSCQPEMNRKAFALIANNSHNMNQIIIFNVFTFIMFFKNYFLANRVIFCNLKV